MPAPFRPNNSKNYQKKQPFDLSKKTRYRGFFEAAQDKPRLQTNKAYATKVISLMDTAALLDLPMKEALEALQDNNVFPAIYRKRSPMYRIKDISDLGKKIGHPFIIPIGLFVESEIYYIGAGLDEIARLWHPVKIQRYNSVFEMLYAAGVPVQTLVFSKEVVQHLESAFLHMAGNQFCKYNKYIERRKDPSLKPKRIILCSTLKTRKYVEKIVHTFNRNYPGVFIAIDQEHLYNLRKRASDRHCVQFKKD